MPMSQEWTLDYSTSITTGIAQKTVALIWLRKMLVSLLQSLEQKRVVVKIDQLIKSCDSLEVCTNKYNEKQSQFLNAVMAKI